ncbi:AsmA family protein [Rhodospira trueperi]|uniref:AsmA family protein n=1 Tax=Rhodospira trueperi TaxID=69960 RepID=A0A1G6XKW2_9PROT|nr:AsmA family protein [Rhodospira trueperi]SDD78859.1 AsmA family protein [Rhodospira trueperi]
MKLSTILSVIVGLVLLVVAGLGVFLMTLDVNQYRPRIAALIAENTGRDVALDGEMDLSIGLTPALVVEDVTIGNADWASDPDMVSVGRLEAQVELIPLLSGRINVVRLVLVDPIVSLETNAEGMGNWQLGDASAAAEPAPEPTGGGDGEGEDGGSAAQFDVQEVRLENGALTYRDGVTGQTIRVALERAAVMGSGLDQPLEVDIAGAYNDAGFALAGTLGPLSALTAPGGSPWPLDVTATAGGATVTVAGEIAEPAAAKGIDLTVTAKGEQIGTLADLAKALGQDMAVPALGAYDVAVRIHGDADALALDGLDASLGSLPLLKTTAQGSVASLTPVVEGINLAVTAQGAEVGDLARIAEQAGQTVAIPALGPFSVAATISGSPEAMAISGLDAGVGEDGGFRATAKGAIANVLAQSGLTLDVAVNAPDPSALSRFGVDLPVPLSARASVRDISGGYQAEGIEVSLGRSQVSGAIEAVLSGPRPAISGQLHAPLLDLDELSGGGTAGASGGGGGSGGSGGSSAPAQGNAGGSMIPDTPLPLDALKAADTALAITADQVVLPNGVEMSGVTLGVTLNDGALTVDPLQAGVAGGQVGGAVSLTPVGNGAASVAVDLNADNVSLGDLNRTFAGSDALQGGPTRLRVSLRGQGATPHQIAGSLDGSVLVHTVDAVMNNGAVNWAGGDVFTQLGDVINPFSDSEPTTPIQCLVFSMTAQGGVLSNDHGIAMETDKMVVGGGGAFDLGAERLNLKIAPRPRPGIGLETGFGKLVELFAVVGPFASPSLELDAEKAVATGLRTAASAAGAVATGGLSLLGENLAGNLLGAGDDGEMEPCLVALGQKEPGQIGADSTESESGGGVTDAVGGLAEDAESTINEAIGDLLGGGGGSGGSGADGTGEQPASDGNSDPLGDAVREGLGGLFGD